jgi:hypothetical protein
MNYRFFGHFVGELEPRVIEEATFAELYKRHIAEHGGDLRWDEFCEEASDAHGGIATPEGDFWAEKYEEEPEEETCAHEWGYSGTAYGGDDERWHGEGRCYCVHCGADGDG